MSIKYTLAYIKSKKYLTRLVSLGFGIVLISWLLSQLDIPSAIEIIRNVSPSFLIAGFLCYGLGFYLRAIRFRLLLPPHKPVKCLFPIVLVHYTALNFIPARLGELSYIYLLKKVNRVSTGYSVSNLLLARVFDHIMISVLFFASSWFLHFSSPWLKTLSLFVSGFFLATFILLMLIFAYKEKCLAWIRTLMMRFNWERYALIQRVLHELEEVVIVLKNVQMKGKFLEILVISGGIWICIFGLNYFSLIAFQVQLSYMEIIFSSTCTLLLKFLPLQILSGFGIHETTWIFIALALGVPKDIAITAAFSSHMIAIVYLVLLGAYGGWRIYPFIRNSANTHADRAS